MVVKRLWEIIGELMTDLGIGGENKEEEVQHVLGARVALIYRATPHSLRKRTDVMVRLFRRRLPCVGRFVVIRA